MSCSSSSTKRACARRRRRVARVARRSRATCLRRWACRRAGAGFAAPHDGRRDHGAGGRPTHRDTLVGGLSPTREAYAHCGNWQNGTMKVLVAMSGGVDSSVAAGLLLEQGHEVVGATLKLWGGVSDSGCCSVADVDDARRVAQMLGIDHHVFNYTEEFNRHVVEPFVRGHVEGTSPNPCIECNRHIKFDLLFERAGDSALTPWRRAITHRSSRAAHATSWCAGRTSRRTRVTCLGYLARRATVDVAPAHRRHAEE